MASSNRISEMLKIVDEKALSEAVMKLFRAREEGLEPELNDAEIAPLIEAHENTEIFWQARAIMTHILAMQRHPMMTKWALDQIIDSPKSADVVVGAMKYLYRHHPEKRGWLIDECAGSGSAAVLFHLAGTILFEDPELAFECYFKAGWLNNEAFKAGLESPGHGIWDEMLQAICFPAVNKPSVWKVIRDCERKYGLYLFPEADNKSSSENPE